MKVLFRYFFFWFYNSFRIISGDSKTLAKWKAIAMIGCFQAIWTFGGLMWLNIVFKIPIVFSYSPKILIPAFGFLLAITNYFIFYHRNKADAIIEESKELNTSLRKRRNIFVILFILVSFSQFITAYILFAKSV